MTTDNEETNTDINERKRAEQARQDIEEQWRAAFESNPTMYFIVDAAGTIVSVNALGAEQLGYRVGELVGQPVLNVFVEPDRQAIKSHADACFAQPGRSLTWEGRKIRKDGTILSVRETAKVVPIRNRPVALIVCEDITERKTAEERLRRERQRFADLVNSIEGIVWEADAETFAFSFVSKQAERILGYPVEQWLSEPTFWKDHLHSEDRDWAVELYRKATAQKRSSDLEYRMIAADGKVRWFRDLVTVLVEDGQPTQLRGVMVEVTKRKRDEEALREQANLLSLTHDAIFVRDMNGTIKYWNRGAQELYGWTAEEAASRVGRELLKTSFPVPLQQIEAEVTHAGRWEGELVHTRKDSSPVAVASRWSLQRDEKGAPVAILVTDNDITKRKCAEEAARRSERELRDAINSVPAHVWSASPEGAVDFVNQRWQEFTGLPLEGALGWNWQAVIHPNELAAFVADWRAALEDGRAMEHEVRVRRADGEYRWWFARNVPLRDERGNIVKWYGTGVDIEDRKRAEEALRRSEAYLAEAQRLTHTGSWAWKPYTVVALYWSEEMLRIFGLDPHQGPPTSETFWERVHPEDRGSTYELLRKMAREKTDYVHDHRIMLPDGTVKHIHAIGHPILNRAGDLVEFVGTAVDVTERKRAEDERERLRQLEADLAHINRVTTMGELMASLAHDVNQPIAAAITNANACLRWLARSHPDVGEAREAAMRMARDGTRALEIIDRLRSFYKKGGPTRHEPVDVNEIVRDMLMLLRSEADRHAVAMHTEFAPEISKVMADRVQLQQVFMNLMLNGIEAMKQTGGELTVRTQVADDGQLLILIKDTGEGLPPGKTDRIFDAFFTTKPEGTGMGLAICRSIIESHGGRLWATSNSGRGATFYFTLPKQRRSRHNAAAALHRRLV